MSLVKPEKTFKVYGTRQYLQEGISKYTFAGQFAEGKNILEIGCENGWGAAYLSGKGATKIVGGDISEKAVQSANENFQYNGLSFLLFDGQKLPFTASSFDIIVAFEVIEHMVKYEDFLQECQGVLKENGLFICSTPNKTIVSPNSDKSSYYQHVKEFYPSEFQALLSKYFKDVVIYGLYPTSRTRSRIKKLVYAPKPKIFYVLKPLITKTINSMPKFVLRNYHSSGLSKIDIDNLDQMLDKGYKPFPIDENPSCSGMLAIGRR